MNYKKIKNRMKNDDDNDEMQNNCSNQAQMLIVWRLSSESKWMKKISFIYLTRSGMIIQIDI